MTTVESILKASNWFEVSGEKTLKELKKLQKEVHPDVCSDSRSSDAFIKLTELFNKADLDLRLAKGWFSNGTIRWVFPKENYDLRDRAFENQKKIWASTSDVKWVAEPYLKDTELHTVFGDGWWPLSAFGKLDKETVAWIMRRLLAVVNVADKEGIIHGDINENTVFIHPDEHGLRLDGWWSGVTVGSPLIVKPIADTLPGFLNGNTVDSRFSVSQISSLLLKNYVSEELGRLLKEWRLRPINAVEAFESSDAAIKRDFGKRVWHELSKPKVRSV